MKLVKSFVSSMFLNKGACIMKRVLRRSTSSIPEAKKAISLSEESYDTVISEQTAAK